MAFSMDYTELMKGFARFNPSMVYDSFRAMDGEPNFIVPPLIVAVKNGDRSKVKTLLQRGEDCNEKDGDGRSPLHWAAFHGHQAIAKDLIDAGADINVKDSINYHTPLHFSAIRNFQGIVELLLSARVNVHAKNDGGFTALHLATKVGHVNIVTTLLSAGAKIDTKSKQHTTALHLSVLGNKLAVFNVLIESGADVNALASQHLTPLMMAVSGKFSIDGIKKMVLKSADVNAREEHRHSPLHLAVVRNGCPMVVEFLLENGGDSKAKNVQGRTALHLLAENSEIAGETRRKIAELLVRYGADIHALEYEHRWTPLQLATYNIQKELVNFLLEECAANANEGGCLTPLHLAVESSYSNAFLLLNHDRIDQTKKRDVIKALLKHGADPNTKEEQERTPFYFAAEHSEFDIVRLLLINGSCYDAKSEMAINQLPVEVATLNPDSTVRELIVLVERFFKAICQNELDKVKKLVTKDKFLVVCRSAHYKTSLHYPSWKGFTEMVKLLLDFGADPNSANSLYSSPLHYAAKFNNPEVVDVLLSRGAYFDAICPLTNKTPKTVAREAKNVASLLVLSKIESLFAEVKIGNNDVIRQLKSFKDKDEKAHLVIQGAKNKEGKRLIDVALDSRHGDISDYLANLEVKF